MLYRSFVRGARCVDVGPDRIGFQSCKRTLFLTCQSYADNKGIGQQEKVPPLNLDEKSPGWFSRLLGIQPIEPMKASHSSMLSDKDVVYELLTHDVKPGSQDDFVDAYGRTIELRKKKNIPGDLLGSWRVAIGNQNQVVNLWKYKDGYAAADKAITSVYSDDDLKTAVNEQAKLCSRQRNAFMLAFSFWGDPKPRSPKHIYELRSYVLKWGNNWARGINYRRDYNQDVAGFFSQIGRLYMVFHIWAYDDLAQRKKVREDTWRKPGWDTNVAYTVPLIKEMNTKIMVPTAYSPMQ